MQNARGEYVQNFASPQVLFERVFGNLKEWQHKLLTQKELFIPQKELRYYQKIAVERVIRALIEQKDRILLTLATGTGKLRLLLLYVIVCLNLDGIKIIKIKSLKYYFMR